MEDNEMRRSGASRRSVSFGDRYVSRVKSGGRPPDRYETPAAQGFERYRARVEELGEYVRDPGSLEAWLWGIPAVERKMAYLVSRNRFADAKRLYDETMSVLDDSFDDVVSMGQAYETGYGDIGKQIASVAFRLVNGEFASDQVKYRDQELPLRDLVMDGGQMAIQDTRDEFESLGVDGQAAEMLFNGTDRQRAVMRSLVNQLAEAKEGKRSSDVRQLSTVVTEVVSNWDRMEEAFGDGVAFVVNSVLGSHQGTQGANVVLRTLTSLAETSDDEPGIETAQNVMAKYDNLVSLVFADADSDDPNSRPGPLMKTTPRERMMFDSTVSSAVAELVRRGATPDIGSPAFAKAIAETMDLHAYSDGIGFDLVGPGHSNGISMAQAGAEYVADMVTLGPDARDSSNVVQSLRTLRSVLTDNVVGSGDFDPQDYRLTGRSAAYRNSVSRYNGGFSSSVQSDGVASAVRSYMFRNLAPRILAGHDFNWAMEDVMSGTPTSATDFTVGLSNVLSRFFVGNRDDVAAASDLVASRVLDSVSSGARLSVSDVVGDMIMRENGVLDTGVKNVLADWYSGSVVDAPKTIGLATEYEDHLKTEGFSAAEAQAMLSRVSAQSAFESRNGRDFSSPFRKAIAMGSVYSVSADATGKAIRVNPLTMEPDPAGVVLARRDWVDRTDPTYYGGYRIGQDNTEFLTKNAEAKRYYDQLEDARKRYASTVASNMAKAEVDGD